MNLLVSDYDGTLFKDIRGLKENIKYIKEFKNEGNHFAISTARSYNSIIGSINKYNIPYDYVFCNDGLVCFDNKKELVYKKTISNEDCKKIISFFDNYNYKLNYRLYNLNGSTISIDNILEILVINSFNKFSDFEKKFYTIYPEYKNILIFSNYFLGCFVRPNCNKSLGLKSMLELTNNNYDRVITIGNDSNDLEMLKDYEGYKVLHSYPNMYFKKIKTVKNVKTLIKKIQR